MCDIYKKILKYYDFGHKHIISNCVTAKKRLPLTCDDDNNEYLTEPNKSVIEYKYYRNSRPYFVATVLFDRCTEIKKIISDTVHFTLDCHGNIRGPLIIIHTKPTMEFLNNLSAEQRARYWGMIDNGTMKCKSVISNELITKLTTNAEIGYGEICHSSDYITVFRTIVSARSFACAGLFACAASIFVFLGSI